MVDNNENKDVVIGVSKAVSADGEVTHEARFKSLSLPREIRGHYDGYGLNDVISVTANELGNGGASHLYVATIDGVEVMRIQLQDGARTVPGSIAGVTERVLMEVLIDRLTCFQNGAYPTEFNDMALAGLKMAKAASHMRTIDRANRGALGRDEK